MRLEVMRATALCWFGNEYLLSADESHLTEVSLKSCFRGCERLEFVRPNAHQFAAPGASFVLGSKTWYRRIKVDGAETIRLHLPLSLLERLPAVFGLVTDSLVGNDIWIQSAKSTARFIEYNAQRFAAWSLPRPKPSIELAAQLGAAVAGLNAEFDSEETPIARRIASLAGSFAEPSSSAEGFEDCIPAEFAPRWRQLSAQAFRTVATLGAEDFGLDDHPALHEQIDGVWKLSLRLLEAIAVEVADERTQAAAA